MFVSNNCALPVTYPARLGARCTGLGAQTLMPKKGFNFLFFCCNSTKKYVEEVEMAWKTKNKQDVELKEGTVYKSVFIHLNNT